MSCDQCRGYALSRPCPCCSEERKPYCIDCDGLLNDEGRCRSCDYEDFDSDDGGDEAGDTA